MNGGRRAFRFGVAGLALLALTACDVPTAPSTSAKPQTRPSAAAAPSPNALGQPSPRSQSLKTYYARVQADLLNRGLLRVDGGGVDTPYHNRDLARNFEQIAFFDEYAPGGGFLRAEGLKSDLRKWTGPVRMTVEFGTSVPQDQREKDRAMVNSYADRLARITRHPISVTDENPNFHVLFMGEDDREQLLGRITQIEPGVDADTLQMIRTLPRDIHCVVAAFAASSDGHIYNRAIAVIRAEHPPLTREACIHEELAQGLGLANDSPRARPSIFNDDDEFALLTSHDEELLRLLYNLALTPGMSAEEARPIVQRLLAGRTGPS